MSEYKPNPRLCRKAARIWTANMVQPRFDQLGDRRGHDAGSQERQAIGQAMVSAICKDTQPWQLELFEIQLYMMLMSPDPYRLVPEEVIPDRVLNGVKKEGTENWLIKPLFDPTNYHNKGYQRSLSVDYHPNMILLLAGQCVGLPEQQHPIKSRLYLDWGSSCISYSFGYGRELTYLYPYPAVEEDPGYWEKRWLRTSLVGNNKDIKDLMLLAASYKTTWIEVDGDEEFHVPDEITDAAIQSNVDEVTDFMASMREKLSKEEATTS